MEYISRMEYISKMDTKIDKWSAEIYALAVNADKAKFLSRSEYRKQIVILRNKQNTAYKQLLELEQAGEYTWENMKPKIEMTWKNIDLAINSAKLNLK